MKKLLSIALCATAVATGYAAGNYVEVATVGVTKVDTASANTIIAVSYEDLAGGDIALSNLVKTATLAEGDQMAVFNNGTYETWTLAKSGDVKYWEKNAKTFLASGSGIVEGESTAADIVTKSVGTGVWIVQKGTPQSIYIYGKPVSGSATSVSVAGAWTLVGNPTQATKDLETVTYSGVANNDQLAIVNADGKIITYQYSETGKDNKHWRRNKAGAWTYDLGNINAGCGFWIRTKSATTITW